MKRIILLLTVFFSFLVSASAQYALTLTNSDTKEVQTFRVGSYLVYELKADYSKHEGYLRGITDSALVFDYAQVSLSQINILAGSSKGKLAANRVGNAVSNTILYAGLTVFDCGTDLLLHGDYYYWPVGGTVWLAGAMIAGVGCMVNWAVRSPEHSVRVRNYRLWNPAIINEEVPAVQQPQNIPTPDSTITTPALTPTPAPAPVEPKKEKKKVWDDDVYGG